MSYLYMLYLKLKSFRRTMIYLLDMVLWNIAYYISFIIIRYTRSSTIGQMLTLENQEAIFFNGFLLLNLCVLVMFFLFRISDRVWRYADVKDFFYICVAVAATTLVFFLLNSSLGTQFYLGKRMCLLMGLLAAFLLVFARFFYRVNRLQDYRGSKDGGRKRLLLVGGGEAGVTILKELSRNTHKEYFPVCIADDDPTKVGRKIYGIKVAGTTADILKLCEQYQIETIFFAISSINQKRRRRILDICSKTGVEVKVLPEVYKLLTRGIPLTKQIRQVEVEDLLGRDPVVFDTRKYGAYLARKNILVTGGGGSIGSELCRQIAKLKPNKLIILDIYENNAYSIQQELLRKYGADLHLEVEIGSVRDAVKVDQVFRKEKIDVVFHAAAHKHVPLMETNPEEAIKNNVFGTLNLCRAADRYHVKHFVQISTDKAVNPTNVMGATKRICEMIIQTINRKSDTEFVAVRFGNVLGSNGSVIPLFKKQIAEGGPVTVTHPDIIRYFMTIPEAVSLVLTAGGLAHGGEIFVLDMGEPVKIRTLAENLIRLSGYKLGEEIKIEYTGLRPGEKLYEELLMNEEGMQKTENEKIFIGQPVDLDYDAFIDQLNTLHQYAIEDNKVKVLEILKETVPTFHHQIP